MLLNQSPAHDKKAHNGKTLQETGLVNKCLRCTRLRRIKPLPKETLNEQT